MIVGVRLLEDCCQPLEASTGVDGGCREGVQDPLPIALKLHEHEVPDLHDDPRLAQDLEALGVQRPTLTIRAQVIVELRTGAARARVRHLPEIVPVAQAEDPRRWHPCLRLPELEGLVVGVMNGHIQTVRIHSQRLCQKGPCILDGLLLEIVPEGEVAEHLEEGVVTRGLTHLLKIVVLPPCADTLLRRDRPRAGRFLLAGEEILELNHPRVRKQKCGIVRRD